MKHESSLKAISTHVPSGFSTNGVNEFKENKHMYYRGKDCMKVLSKKLLKIGKEISNEEKHDMKPLTDDEKKQHEE